MEPPDDTPLQQFLANRDVPCPACGYNLRGLTSARCPECAERLALSVALQLPRLAGFLSGLIGLATGMGFSGWLLIYVLIRFASVRTILNEFVAVTGAGLIAETAALWGWLRYERRQRARGGRISTTALKKLKPACPL